MQSRLAITAIAAIHLAGCASIVNDSTQQVRVETRTASGEPIRHADCVAFNDRAVVRMKSGDSQQIRRSSMDLHMVCTTPGQPPALATITSRANAGLAGNVVFGGLVGAAIDHSRGTAYSYPGWIQVVFGEARMYDMQLEKPGQRQEGYAAGTRALPDRSGAHSQVCMYQVMGTNCGK